MLRLELQKKFERIDAAKDLDPNQLRKLETPKESPIVRSPRSHHEQVR